MKARRTSPILIAALALAAITFSLAVCAQAQETVLYDFPNPANGARPESSLTLDSAGNLYSTTLLGGSASDCTQIGSICGTVFEMSHGTGGWIETVLAKFNGDANGGDLFEGVVRDAAGNLYGSTEYGGSTQCDCGVVYKLSRDTSGQWKETVLHTFSGPDGANPLSNLILDAAGNLYGTTQNGGNPIGCKPTGCGVAFRLTHTSTGWHESVLYSFRGSSGHNPFSGLVQDAAGNLYGATDMGGNQTCQGSCGTVYQLSPTASGPWTQTTLFSFTGGADGAFPRCDLVLDAAGNLYGTAEEGGANNKGVVFELSPGSGGSWAETILYNFTGGSEGSFPESGVIFDSAGNLYGSTTFGGDTVFCNNGCGAIYTLSPSGGGWVESPVYTFQGDTDGYNPSGLVLDAAGNLYGTAGGGSLGNGVVFKVATP